MYILTQVLNCAIRDVIEDHVTSFTQHFLDSLHNGPTLQNYLHLIQGTQAILKPCLQTCITTILESMDQTYRDSTVRKQFAYVKVRRSRTLWTIHGPLTYCRTIYQPKHGGPCFCYLDELLGLPRYTKFDPSVCAHIHQRASETNSLALLGRWIGQDCFGQIGRTDAFISRQTIRNILKKAPRQFTLERAQRTPETLYIMADEKYIAMQGQDKQKQMIKCAVSYEHRVDIETKRPGLSNKVIFASLSPNFWEDFLDRLSERYDLSQVKHFILMGDGANWIKSGCEALRTFKDQTVVFHLDHFHYKQALHRFTLDPSRKREIDHLIATQPTHTVRKELKRYDTEDLKPTQAKSLKYLIHHISDIKRCLQNPQVKCSMEGQISHELAAIFSSIPKGYSLNILNILTHLRTAHHNGINVFQHSLHHQNRFSLDANTFDYSIFNTKKDHGRIIQDPKLYKAVLQNVITNF